MATSVAAPAAAVEVADSFKTVLPLPGAARLEGVKVAVTPAGSPSTENVTAELRPPRTALVKLTVTVLPRFKTGDVVFDVRVRPGTNRVSVAVLVTPPPVAVTVKG